MTRIHVTEAEAVLLEVLWRLGPLPPARLIAEVKAARPWRDTTIKTLLGRLRRKRLVWAEPEGGLTYRPAIDRSAFVESEVRSLAERLFAGDLEALSRSAQAAARGELSGRSPPGGTRA